MRRAVGSLVVHQSHRLEPRPRLLSHGVGASQPKQQGSTVQLLNIISSPVSLSACGARLEAAAELEGDARHNVLPTGYARGAHTRVWSVRR